MNWLEYQVEAFRTAAVDPQNIPFSRVIFALGLNGEAGELGDIVKKEVGHGHPEDMSRVMDEAGDVLWYLACLCTLYGLKLDDVAENNIQKLKARYPEGFTTERSMNRE